MAEVLAKAEKYINGEEALLSKMGGSSLRKEKWKEEKKRDRSPKKERERDRSPRRDKDRSLKRRGNVRDHLGPPKLERQSRYAPRQFTPLTATISQVLYEVNNEKFLRWQSRMKIDPTKRDPTKYCDYHRDLSHHIIDYIQLKK